MSLLLIPLPRIHAYQWFDKETTASKGRGLTHRRQILVTRIF